MLVAPGLRVSVRGPGVVAALAVRSAAQLCARALPALPLSLAQAPAPTRAGRRALTRTATRFSAAIWSVSRAVSGREATRGRELSLFAGSISSAGLG